MKKLFQILLFVGICIPCVWADNESDEIDSFNIYYADYG